MVEAWRLYSENGTEAGYAVKRTRQRGTVLVGLAYASKDKIWVVVLKPTIFVQAEEDARRKRLEDKVKRGLPRKGGS